jgi:hypothetical protein
VYLRIARTQDLFPDVRNDPPEMVTTLLERKKSITDRENAGPLPRCKECSSRNGEHITGKKKVLKHITYMYSTHNRNKDL